MLSQAVKELFHVAYLYFFFFSFIRQSRLMAYRQFICWAYRGERLGKGVRRVLPACVVTAIRARYADPQEEYTGFMEVRDALDIDD